MQKYRLFGIKTTTVYLLLDKYRLIASHELKFNYHVTDRFQNRDPWHCNVQIIALLFSSICVLCTNVVLLNTEDRIV